VCLGVRDAPLDKTGRRSSPGVRGAPGGAILLSPKRRRCCGDSTRHLRQEVGRSYREGKPCRRPFALVPSASRVETVLLESVHRGKIG
jgi:hypothetical protein